jgi:hypothetical protein
VAEPKLPDVSDRPLWLIALMLVFHLAWLVFCALWIPMSYGAAISRQFGSPAFILPVIVLVYALAPLVASFSKLGREYWDLLGRGGSARRAVVKLLILAAVTVVVALVVRHMHVTP